MHATSYSIGHRSRHTKIRNRTTLWLSLGLAFGLHLLVLLIPLPRPLSDRGDTPVQIEMQLTTLEPTLPPQQAPASPVEPLPEPIHVPAPQTSSPVINEPKMETVVALPPDIPVLQRDLEHKSVEEKSRLTSLILSRQFITEEFLTDRLFGKPLEQGDEKAQRAFHFPKRQDLVSMLDQPLPDVPFEYTPGLIYFAYDPGVRGDLQRFWDVITPEFGWTTKHGTEVKCVWLLVIAGCGWK